jgi:dipeptidyl aminopeptidase/acylaminoacyl peptidase
MQTEAQKKKQKHVLIDREVFFDTPKIAGGQLSPDGKWISFMKEYKGTINVWVKKFDEPFEKAVPLTDNERPIGGYFWTDDSRYILYVKDKGGDENYHIYSVDPLAKADATTGVPESKDLTPMDGVRAQIYQVSRKNPNILMVGINDRDKSWHDLYQLDISTGQLTKLFENTDRIVGWDFDWDEKARLAYRSDENGFSQIMRIDDGNKFTKIYETNLQESAYVTGWNKDNSKMYLVSNKGDADLTALYLMDPNSLKLEKVESDPKNKVDFGGLFIDDNTRDIIYTSYTYDKMERNWKNDTWKKNYEYLQSKFPGREVGFASFTKDYKKMLVSVGGDVYASDTYFFDTDTKQLIHQYTPRPELKKVEAHLSPMTAITYKSSDGLEIPAYLTLPVSAKKKKKLPLVALIHGGPKGPRDAWGYDPYAQILANRGYAVLQPNFRASGGYGKAFLNAGDREWGRKMQDDITWGVNHLIAKGIIDKNKVAIMGGSYGGYATLAGLTFTPDLYTCGVDIVGPSNLYTLLASIPAYWEAGRKRLYEMTGDPNTEEGKKLIEASSPLFHVDKIKKPLLIVQGANDPRVKQAESDQIVVAMRDSGKEVGYILAEDEGHGFRKPVNQMAMWAATEKFLAKHLGGQYQTSMTDEVAKRLGEIEQDVRKVTYTKPEAVTVAQTLPIPTSDLSAGEQEYDMLIEVQGQKIPLSSKRTIIKEGSNWVITTSSQSPMGEATDAIYLAEKSLSPVKRIIKQAGQTIEMDVADGKLSTSMMGKTAVAEVGNTFLFDGTQLDLYIARLPLKEGYTLGFQSYDPMSQQTKTKKLSVLGKEGDLWKVRLVSSDNEQDESVFLIDPNKKMATQVVQTVPMMGNAKVTMTLK